MYGPMTRREPNPRLREASSDYIVTFMVPLTIRIENVDDITTAEDFAQDALVNANLPALLDATPFYVGTEVLDGLPTSPDEAHDLNDHSLADSVAIWRD